MSVYEGEANIEKSWIKWEKVSQLCFKKCEHRYNHI